MVASNADEIVIKRTASAVGEICVHFPRAGFAVTPAQLWLASIGTTVPTVNVSATALRFFFKITLQRRDLADAVVSGEPCRLPVVLSPDEVARLLAAAINIKHKALLSLAYATGVRALEVVVLKLTNIDRDRMLIWVEQGKGKKEPASVRPLTPVSGRRQNVRQ